MGWAADVTDVEFRTVGLLEVLGALGLVLPGALGVAPLVTPLAAGTARRSVSPMRTCVTIAPTMVSASPTADAPRVSRDQRRTSG